MFNDLLTQSTFNQTSSLHRLHPKQQYKMFLGQDTFHQIRKNKYTTLEDKPNEGNPQAIRIIKISAIISTQAKIELFENGLTFTHNPKVDLVDFMKDS